MDKARLKEILSSLTLEEKASLCSGADFWHTKKIEGKDIPVIMMSDGPHGLRKMEGNDSIKAVCFPAACALACSYDRELVREMGKALGNECQSEGVAVLLGPGANIKRSPLCGRNFEYFSEDPYLASQMAAAHINGVQSMGVGSSLKHFAANNQETRRLSVSAEVDERAFREIYLSAFEYAVKEARPQTVMCSYNKIWGEYSSQNKRLLTDILRDEWGFEGLVVSDWGAVDDRPKGVAAGLDLEMPGSMGKNDKRIVEAVKNGELDEADLDKVVMRVLDLIYKGDENRQYAAKWDKDKDRALARKIAAQCIVLLKNDKKLLPLDTKKKIAFIGEFASKPRFQGGGSSHINVEQTASAIEASKEYADVSYAQGYITSEDKTDEALLTEAVALAEESDTVVVFAGLPDSFESEGFDRQHMKMPQCQLELIDRILGVNKNVVVVLHNGAPVEMPFADKVKGIVECYLGGEMIGAAVCDVLFGKVNPSGKLAETFPKKLSDNPSFLNFPGEGDVVRYKEGIFVGYRYYEKKDMEVLFPFGHGLSYTEFEYSDITLSADEIKDSDILTVTVNIKNTGKRDGKEAVQLYVRDTHSSVIRPEKELKGFEKVSLKAGESKRVVFKLDKRAFAYYNTDIKDWYVEYGQFEILIGSSSADIRQKASVYVETDNVIPMHFDLDSLGGEVLSFPEGRKIFGEVLKLMSLGFDSSQADDSAQAAAEAMFNDMPLHAMVSFISDERITRELLESMVEKLNKAAIEYTK
ncbi:glycoside hydrolase family 3 C-terminal domain-containing protein [Ruminococcus sp. NK3A76]|uniref:glycoside hydrolase family 3 C-terminal domain-containing protein n=1 Tax=Ruminococcus sp. NK3A76 TaxID=877411 RepID=UPI00048ACC8C|nr:glycoside hydrolase family 3 C-terminal domain-containing protein [Ruminococcus sp. NK3A76]